MFHFLPERARFPVRKPKTRSAACPNRATHRTNGKAANVDSACFLTTKQFIAVEVQRWVRKRWSGEKRALRTIGSISIIILYLSRVLCIPRSGKGLANGFATPGSVRGFWPVYGKPHEVCRRSLNRRDGSAWATSASRAEKWANPDESKGDSQFFHFRIEAARRGGGGGRFSKEKLLE